jgi:hypothetical protein
MEHFWEDALPGTGVYEAACPATFCKRYGHPLYHNHDSGDALKRTELGALPDIAFDVNNKNLNKTVDNEHDIR